MRWSAPQSMLTLSTARACHPPERRIWWRDSRMGSDFYVLERWPRDEDSSACTEFLSVDPSNTGEANRCPACGEFTSMLPWLPPHKAELEAWGTEYGDLVFGPGDEILVSEKFKDIYHACGLSGLTGFDPVHIRRVRRHRSVRGTPPSYFCARVSYGRAAIDQGASGFVWATGAPTCQECRSGRTVRSWQRLVVEPGTWSGEDICFPRGARAYLCSRRFRDMCVRHGIANAVLIPADHYPQDYRIPDDWIGP
jgi:hypothetical protein